MARRLYCSMEQCVQVEHLCIVEIVSFSLEPCYYTVIMLCAVLFHGTLYPGIDLHTSRCLTVLIHEALMCRWARPKARGKNEPPLKSTASCRPAMLCEVAAAIWPLFNNCFTSTKPSLYEASPVSPDL